MQYKQYHWEEKSIFYCETYLYLKAIQDAGSNVFSYFLLGLNIAQSNFGACQAISSIFIFSISSPIGIGIGMVLVNMEKSLAGDIANGILQVNKYTAQVDADDMA